MPPSFESNYRMSEQELDQLLRPSVDLDGRNVSEIAKFYDGRTVLVTGATGFVGRLVVEKLLRACMNIKRVYVLVRAKRGKTVSERLNELTNSIVFDGLRALNVNIEEKLCPIEGDLTEDLFGLSEQKLAKLAASGLSVIIHSAASVNFQEALRDATLTNIVGLYNTIKLAKRLQPNFEALVYVSTAYSNCIKGPDISERVYPSEVDPMVLMKLAEFQDREACEEAKDHFLGPFPNTYTYTKHLAETLCLKHAHELPIVICRPSVVVCTWREPIQGFVDNINGGNGVNYGPASGLSATMQADNRVVLDYVPVDVVVNCIVALGWFCAQFHAHKQRNFTLQHDAKCDLLAQKMQAFHERQLEQLQREQLPASLANVPVFHASSGVENPIRCGKFKELMIAYANKYPTLQLYRGPRMTYWRSKRMYELTRFFNNTMMAKLMDYLQAIGCFKPEIYDKTDTISRKKLAFRCERIDHFVQTIVYFLTNHWNFRPDNRQMLVDEFMDEEDRRLFNCDMRKLDWNEYCEIYALGMRKFLLKEPIETVERARSRLSLINLRNSAFQLALIVLCTFYFLIHFFEDSTI